MAYFWPIVTMIASGVGSAAGGVKGPTAQAGQATPGGGRKTMEYLRPQASKMIKGLADMKYDADVGGILTAQRAPEVTSGTGGTGLQGAPQRAPNNPAQYGSPRGSDLMMQRNYGSPRGSDVMSSAGGGIGGAGRGGALSMGLPTGAAPQSISGPTPAPTPAPTPTLGAAPQAPGATPPTVTPTTPQGPPTNTMDNSASAAGSYAAIAGALANIAQSAKGQSVQAPGFIPGTVQGLQPTVGSGGGRTVATRGGGDMDMSQLIRMLSSQRGRRRF